MSVRLDKVEAGAILAYYQRVESVKQRFGRLPHGSQQNAAIDLGIASTTVSSVLRGRIKDPNVLSRLEGWLDAYGPQPLTR